METPCWSPSEGLQLAWRQETSGNICSLLFLSQKVSSLCQTWKHSHRHFFQHIGYSELENIRRIDIFVHVTCYPETTHCAKNTVFYFWNKAVYQAEHRPADMWLKMTFTWWRWKLKIFNVSFYWRHLKTKNRSIDSLGSIEKRCFAITTTF